MAKRISVDARRELVRAIGERYREAAREDKLRILDEFVAVTGYHRKHSIRVLNSVAAAIVTVRRPRLPLYDEALSRARRTSDRSTYAFAAPKSQAARRPFEHRLIARETAFRATNPEAKIQELYSLLAHDGARNRMILNDVIGALEEGRSPLLLTERTDHLDYFAAELSRVARQVIVLKGGMGAKATREVFARMAAIPADAERVVLATGRYIGEGFDNPRLDTLFMTLPVSWQGTLIQYAGRLHRLRPGKREVQIFDYVDHAVPMLARMFAKRLRGYRSIGYARGEAPLGYAEPKELTIEYDPNADLTVRPGGMTVSFRLPARSSLIS